MELKTALQLPPPPDKVIVQFVSAPVMDTVPVGVTPEPLTVTPTVTTWPGAEGLGVWAVIAVTLDVVEPTTV
jgi:hypothetical protein